MSARAAKASTTPTTPATPSAPATPETSTRKSSSPEPVVDSPHSTPSKSYLQQKFAKLEFGQLSLIGYSVAGEETVVQVPELNVCFDIGRAPQFALTSDLLCISHGHMDHVAGIAYYLSQRYFQGMKPGTILLPAELERPVEEMLRAWQRIERQNTPFTLVPMRPGQMHPIRKDFGIRALRTHHGGPSLGYACISIRQKLRQEYHGRPGEELARLKQQGIEIQYTVEVPLVTYLGDTGLGPVFEEPDVAEARLLITECTFFEEEHRRKSRAGRHFHVAELMEVLGRLRNEHVILLHVSRRTGLPRARRLLREALVKAGLNAEGSGGGPQVHMLMDLRDARSAGDAAAPAGIVEGT